MFPTKALGENTVTLRDLDWAQKYINEHIVGSGIVRRNPQIRVLEFPKDLVDKETYAGTFKKTAPEEYAWVGKVPDNGLLVFRNDVDLGTIKWKGVLLHEYCHVLDFFTKDSCSCDPYSLQILYYYSQNIPFETIGNWTAWNRHNYFRKCNWKGKI